MWEINDHIKDAWKHHDFAIDEKERGDTKGAKAQQMKGFSRIQKAKETLHEFSEYIRECEYRDKHTSMDAQSISEKYCAWHTLGDLQEKELEEMEKVFEEIEI